MRYGEVDRMGFLYHSHYVEYFDVGRSEMMREVGMPNSEIEARGIELPVLKVEIDYKKPAFYDDLLTIRTTLRELPKVKIRFDYEVFSENGELITTGAVTLAFMNAKTKRPVRCPEFLIEAIAKYLP
ncbi:4-hydroxybenzoyl-CoA thioesterase family active site [Mucinivorans hirudinis]|uniref:4-hydroxybenzoyl-CoA thioesterase family active site n=1 Tax=Mucinivorans hirudinis TaxID=1433126 RepID=A0A060R6S0_9BACT|nr:4-hydroxybenzoyl-CoA thioesterase family active site [Mucinivorans hirudinis]